MKLDSIWQKVTFIVISLIPFIPMLYLYQRNSDYVLLSHILFVSTAMVIISSAIYGALVLIFRNIVPAVAGTVFAWITFFGYGLIYDHVRHHGFRHRYMLPITLFIWVIIFIFLRLTAKRSQNWNNEKQKYFFVISCTFIAFLLVWNIGFSIPPIVRKLGQYSTQNKGLIKTNFNIDDGTEKIPSLYWIHCDGMLGFDSMEKYFGDPQKEFTQFLTDNGFMINRHANFEAGHQTVRAIPTLMCPGFYDAVMAKDLSLLSNSATLYIARMNNELIRAFTEKGYTTVMISGIGMFFPPITNIVYDVGHPKPLIQSTDWQNDSYRSVMKKADYVTSVGSMNALLQQVTMLDIGERFLERFAYYLQGNIGERSQIPAYSEEVAQVIENPEYARRNVSECIRSLLDSFNIEGPKFTVVFFDMAHNPFIYDEYGNLHENDSYAPSSYPPHHTYSAKVLQNIIHEILTHEPNAIIVLQADHGLHNLTKNQIISSFGEGAEKDIWNGVISSVRIPEIYGTPDKLLEPLDISRYLVNTYVGENYAYLE